MKERLLVIAPSPHHHGARQDGSPRDIDQGLALAVSGVDDRYLNRTGDECRCSGQTPPEGTRGAIRKVREDPE